MHTHTYTHIHRHRHAYTLIYAILWKLSILKFHEPVTILCPTLQPRVPPVRQNIGVAKNTDLRNW